MAPKVNCNPVKLASIIAHLQKSRVAHNIKDLEKHLPSVASINGMQVKDYLQALSDEDKIHVEKIGSGNWYWSFASEEKKVRETGLENARAAHDKATAVNDELRLKIKEVEDQHKENETVLDGSEVPREQLLSTKVLLAAEIRTIRVKLSACGDDDPAELERRIARTRTFKADALQVTDDVYAMEGWLKAQGQGSEGITSLQSAIYGDEYDEEEGMLRELE